MVHINSTLTMPLATHATLTAPLALSLAANAYNAGRLETAVRYVEIAYAIFDAQLGAAALGSNVSPKGD